METKRRLVYVILIVCLLCAMVTQLTSGTERVADVPYNNAGIKVFSQEFAESYHVLFVDGNDLHVYIGAVHTEQEDGPGYVFKVHADDISELVAEEVFEVKNNTGTGAIACRAYSTTPETSCRNFIKVIMIDASDTSSNTLLVCGTNAEWPRCYYVEKQQLQILDDFLGSSKCPRKQEESVTARFGIDNKLYTGLVQDTNKPAIARSPTSNQSTELQTEEDSKWLNGAEFISSHSVNSEGTQEVLFFFRETANENENQYPEELTYSRVAKVCEKDEGGNVNVLNARWSSFLKARLDCSVTNGDPYTEYQQFYDVLEDSVKIGNDFVYAIFSGQRNGVSMPALCVYDLRKMSGIFNSGNYWDQESVGKVWKKETPNLTPNPGECDDDSTSLTDDVLNALKQHPLMADLIPSEGSPLLTSYTGVRFTKIVDTIVGGKTILYIGTDKGTVMKVDYNNGNPFVLEEVQVSEEGSPVMVMTKSEEKKSLYIGFDDKVVQVPMYQCHRYTTCSECNGAKDPHCAWDGDSCEFDISSSEYSCSEAQTSKQVQLGQTLIISCAVRNVDWTVNSVSIHADGLKYIDLDGVGLTITNFQESDAGLYEARRPGDIDVVQSMNLWLTESAGKLVFLDPLLESQSKATCQGRVVNLFCNADGPTGFTITWKTPDGSVVTDESRVQWANVVNCENSRRGVSWLAVEVSINSTGLYTCEISDGGTTKTAAAEVSLQECVTTTSIQCQNDRYEEAHKKYTDLENEIDCTTPTPIPGNESCQCKVQVIDCNDCCTGEDTCPAN